MEEVGGPGALSEVLGVRTGGNERGVLNVPECLAVVVVPGSGPDLSDDPFSLFGPLRTRDRSTRIGHLPSITRSSVETSRCP